MRPDQTLDAHTFCAAEEMWLRYMAEHAPIDPKVAKVALFGKLPRDFDSRSIDLRFYRDGRLTLLAVHRFKPDSPILEAIDTVVTTIREKIISDPGVEEIDAIQLANQCQVTPTLLADVFNQLAGLGHFLSGSRGSGGTLASISLAGPDAYDDYLSYAGLKALLDRAYQQWAPSRSTARYLPLLRAGIEFDDGEPRAELHTSTIKRNVAFIIMPIDPDRPELVDVHEAIKSACKAFGIQAFRADEIEHDEKITDLVLKEIQTCEYLIADLSLERPNVYYEVGYAHALNKKPILYRKHGTRLHFDLSVHKVLEYRNATELRGFLSKRLEDILGRNPAAT